MQSASVNIQAYHDFFLCTKAMSVHVYELVDLFKAFKDGAAVQ